MITNSFRALLAELLIAGGNSNLYGTFPYVTATGVTKYVSGYTYTPQPWSIASSASAAGIHFGSGTTPASADDYAIESRVSPSATITGTRRTKTADGWAQSIDITLTNTDEEPMTISEVAFYGTIRGAASEGGTTAPNSDLNVLFDRTLLNEPITIPAGDAATMTYTVSVSL